MGLDLDKAAPATKAEGAGAPTEKIEITPEMIEAGVEFAAITLDPYPIADFSIRLLVEEVLERAMRARSCRARQ